jgi:hypothetical protein
VGAVHSSRIYHFDLNSERNDLVIPETVIDKFIKNSPTYVDRNIVFADDFGGITDLTVGPDGYLYVVSIGQGKVFRIMPTLPINSNLQNIQSEELQDENTANLSTANDSGLNNQEGLPAMQSERQQQDIPTDGINKELLVSIVPLKDPVSRGESQSITITVTDSASKPIVNAEISGILLYPGDNYEKQFSGITDLQGKFVYPWIIGQNGDAGTLAVEVDVSSQAHDPASAVSSFEIIGSS